MLCRESPASKLLFNKEQLSPELQLIPDYKDEFLLEKVAALEQGVTVSHCRIFPYPKIPPPKAPASDI